ncbi:hypothetical protein, partial [uncultured Shimia sp.]|uniref:hypothetical protein n=1 Tax=uncultured Shimia sp. TaxID=573152 RepID=UPI0025FF7E77
MNAKRRHEPILGVFGQVGDARGLHDEKEGTMADPNGPGIVDGTENDDTMSVGYVDVDGDTIDNSG